MPIKRKIYIAGKVTGLPHGEVNKKFNTAEAKLLSEGWSVVNPTLLIAEETEWTQAMVVCIEALSNCHAIYMLPDWEDSDGAKMELSKARELDMEIIFELPNTDHNE